MTVQIFTELSKDPEHTLPESAYTSVIRACCLDGRADAGRETLGALTRNGGLPRLRCLLCRPSKSSDPFRPTSVSKLLELCDRLA